ncbi:MAG TPA: carboxypeptidase-like regulatory domain-containing protein, partial [Pyrinomonadaceae bacterium]|nr:carboxypeptidase-like regulatory domain-containing protein [Pyrinomonadaceae bacterium]
EAVEDVNIQLAPGGVITGKVTDAEGEPLMAVTVKISPIPESMQIMRDQTLWARLYVGNETDDRGIYRAFGLPAGKYKVSVGESGSGRTTSREYYKETFFPSVTDAAKATVIEVKEGSEATDVDITMGRPVGAFKVAGRVIDGDTGKPIPNVNYGVGQRTVNENGTSFSSSSSNSSDRTNANGEFRLENVTPGKYTIYTEVPEGSDVSSASVTFDVVDRDVTNLVITMRKGGSLSGVVAFEGNQAGRVQLSSLKICATVQGRNPQFSNAARSPIGQDGSFRINGVRSGLASLWLCASDVDLNQFQIVRVERNGVAQAENFNVGESEQVTGLRVLVKHVKLTGAIRGQVKVETGELPPISRLWLDLWPLDENLQPQPQSSISSPKLDARGHFLAEGLPAGTYRLTIAVSSPAGNRSTQTTQQVIVTDDAVTEVTVIIKPDPK